VFDEVVSGLGLWTHNIPLCVYDDHDVDREHYRGLTSKLGMNEEHAKPEPRFQLALPKHILLARNHSDENTSYS
jgi:hypothetical protein